MAFVNLLLLLGVLGVAIPIIIQLLTRRHSNRIPWGAMIFLQAAVNRRKRRVLLEDMLLLACRCLLPALAALALARPFVTPDSQVPWAVVIPAILLAITLLGVSFALWRYPKWRHLTFLASLVLAGLSVAAILFERRLNLRKFGGDSNRDVALIIDGSASMSMVGSDGKSNFDHALEEAAKYVEESDRDTAFAFIVGGPVPVILNPVPVSDRRVLRDTLQQLRPSQGTMRATSALTAAAFTLAYGNNPVKQIVVVGDGQTVGWDLGSDGRWSTIRNLFGQFTPAPVVAWRTLPLPGSIRNLAVSGVSLSRPMVGTDRDVTVRVTVQNSGTEAVTPDAVTLSIGPTTLKAPSPRQLEPGASQTFEFTHRFERPGAAVLVATVDAKDDLPADDTFRYVVPVLDTLRVLVVDGDASGPPLARGATYLSLALRPETVRGSAAAERSGFLLSTTVEDVTRAASRKDFSQFSVVALCNVPRLSDAALAALALHVRNGGGLLVFPGAKSSPKVFNAWSSAGEPVLPLQLGEWTSRDPADPEPPAIDPSSFVHDALLPFRTGGDLSAVAPLQRWLLRPAAPGDSAFVSGKFTDGAPLLAVKPFGRGTVALSALPLDPVASELTSRRAFVPFVHELTYYLAQPLSPQLNVLPSDGARLILAPNLVAPAADASAAAHGVHARYYPQKGLKGEPVVRIEKNFSLHWGGGAPAPKIPGDNFSAVLSATLTAPADGPYTFRVQADDRATLALDGKRIARSGDNNGSSARMLFKAGERHLLEISYEEDWQQASCSLRWTPPGGREEDVPADVLSPEGRYGDVVQVVDPSGEAFPAELVQGREGTVLEIARTLLPGLYVVRPPERGFPSALASSVTAEGDVRFFVRAGIEESTMLAITQDQADDLRRYVTLALATKEDDVLAILHGSAFGREIWRLFAVAALIFLVAEIALARWISIQRRQGEETNVDFTNEGEMGKSSFKDALKRLKGK